MQKKILSIKTIFNSMIATSLILLLLLGFIIVEKNTRKIGFADNNPWFIYKDSYDDGHYFKIRYRRRTVLEEIRFMNKFCTVDFSGLYNVTDAILNYVNQFASAVKNMSKNM